QRLDAVLAEVHLRTALGHTLAPRVVLLAVSHLARNQHGSALRLLLSRRLRRCGRSSLGGGSLGLLARGSPLHLGRRRGRAGGAGAARTRRTVPPRSTLGCLGFPLGLGLQPADEVALVDPHLHADAAERGTGLEEAVVDVGAQRVQRDTAVAVVLGPGHLGTAETTGALHANALDLWRPHRRLDRLAHGTAERDTVGQLLGDALCDQLSIRLGVLHLEDVQLHLLAGELLQRAADPVGLRTAAADHDAGTRGVDVHPDAVASALDLHLGDARPLHAGGQQLADLAVLTDVLGVLLVGVPARLPVGGDAEPETVRVDLLAHYRPPAFFFACFGRDSTTTVMWLVRFRIRYARPCARGRIRFSVGPSSAVTRFNHRVSGSSPRWLSALAAALWLTFASWSLAARGAHFRTARAAATLRPLISSITRRTFIGESRTKRARATAVGSSSAVAAFVGAFIVASNPS